METSSVAPSPVPALFTFPARVVALLQKNDLALAVALTLVCAASRLAALPASFWEWDEILFFRALHRFNVAVQSPHPPGFPVYVALGKIAYALFGDEFRALVTITFIGAALLGAALFYFYREVFQDRVIALAGALLCCFLPNVWVYSGAPRSDGPALTLGLIALTLILRGMKSNRALLLGCAVFSVGLGVRVTLLPWAGLVLALVLLARLRQREWRLTALALLILAASVLAWYVPMVWHHGWDVYHQAARRHQQYVWEWDSLFSLYDNSVLAYRWRRFFVDLWGTRWIMWTVYTFSALGALLLAWRRWRTLGWLAAAFLPYLAFSFILNNPMQALYYLLPMMPLYAGLSAYGLITLSRRLFAPERRPLLSQAGFALVIVWTIALAHRSYPMVRLLHREPSPTARAVNYLRATLDPQRDMLFYDGSYEPFVINFLPQIRSWMMEKVENPETNLLSPSLLTTRTWAITEAVPLGGESQWFHWPFGSGRSRLNVLSLGRYFDVFVTELTDVRRMIFQSGWYPIEHWDEKTWRWMGRQATVFLLGGSDTMTLRLNGSAALAQPGATPAVTLRLNGKEIDRFTTDGKDFARELTVKVDPALLWSSLHIEIDQAVRPKDIGVNDDDRELGIRVTSLQWKPAPGAAATFSSPAHFLGEGWYDVETNGKDIWRWMKERASVRLPFIDGDAQLDLVLLVPPGSDGARANVTVAVAGQVLDTITPPAEWFAKTYKIPATMQRAPHTELTLSTGATVKISESDPRPVGALVYQVGWRASEQK